MKIPKFLSSLNIFIVVTFISPIFYLFFETVNINSNILEFIKIWDFYELFFKTFSLVVGVVTISLILGLSSSLIISRFKFKGSKIILTLLILPLVFPSYIGALTYASAFSSKGLVVNFLTNFGIQEISGISGYIGSLIVLSLFTYPYVLLICFNTISNLDNNIEEAAKSLGSSKVKLFTRVILPRLKQPITYSALLVGLYVLSDFGAVSIMKYSTLTKVIYTYYEIDITSDAVYLYSTLLLLTSFLLSFIQRNSDVSNQIQNSSRSKNIKKKELNKFKLLITYTYFVLIVFFSLILPTLVLFYWLKTGLNSGLNIELVYKGIFGSIFASVTTGVLAFFIAIPITVAFTQYKSSINKILEKVILTLYGLPHITIGISLLFISLKYVPRLYQSFTLLIFSYLIVFLPQAIGAGKASTYQISSSFLEASSVLGFSRLKTFYKVTFPMIRNGILSGSALVFLSTIKELPQTLLLRPTGFKTLAIDIWSFSIEGQFTDAAFSSIILLAISAIPTYILSTRNLRSQNDI